MISPKKRRKSEYKFTLVRLGTATPRIVSSLPKMQPSDLLLEIPSCLRIAPCDRVNYPEFHPISYPLNKRKKCTCTIIWFDSFLLLKVYDCITIPINSAYIILFQSRDTFCLKRIVSRQ